MHNVNGTDYRLCYLDTNAVSEMVKEPALLRHFVDWSLAKKPLFVPAFSPFTIIELRQNADVYQKFVDLFGIYPCEVLKGYEQLLEEEVRCYPNPSEVDPLLPIGGGVGNRLGPLLDATFRIGWVRDRERTWLEEQMEIVDGMRSLVPNYPSAGATYTPSEIQTFLQIAGLSQLAMRAPDFVRRMLESGQEIDIDAFPSLKITLYTAFQKFYTDRARRPSRSDAFDIIISTGTPYVEAIITENHQAEALRQIRRRDTFIEDLLVFTLRDFRRSSPVSA
jgi:hypothetical protein